MLKEFLGFQIFNFFFYCNLASRHVCDYDVELFIMIILCFAVFVVVVL